MLCNSQAESGLLPQAGSLRIGSLSPCCRRTDQIALHTRKTCSAPQRNRLQRITLLPHAPNRRRVAITQRPQRRNAVLCPVRRHTGQQATCCLRVKNKRITGVMHHRLLVAQGAAQAHVDALQGADDAFLHTLLRTVLRKGGLTPGDALILTKPIGTGTLFAAHARLAAKGRWVDAALQSMVLSNQKGAQCLREFGATACTDLTGFGLLGHLVEMTRPSGVDAEIDLAALPLLDGAQECVAAGIVSSLQSANVRLRRALRNQEAVVNHPRYPLIFDPQTAGGLLASVPADRAQDCIAALRALGYVHTTAIGRVLTQSDALEPITLRV